MNSKNSKTFNPHRVLLNIKDKINLNRSDNFVALSNLSMYDTWQSIKGHIRPIGFNKFQISAPTWNEEFESPGVSYSISDIQDYFEYILKNHGENTINPSLRIHVSKIESRITFKIKKGYYLELLTPETMKLLGSTKSKVTKNENDENVPYLEITEVLLVHCITFNNNHQQNSRVLYTFAPNKSFGQLLDISPKCFIFFKTFDSEFSYIDVWFTNQNSKPLEMEDKINIILVIN